MTNPIEPVITDLKDESLLPNFQTLKNQIQKIIKVSVDSK